LLYWKGPRNGLDCCACWMLNMTSKH
jgi:hypothetical protein